MSYLFVLIVVLLVAYGILKQYNPQAVLLCAGLFLLSYAHIAGISNVLPSAKSKGSFVFDLWDLFNETVNKNFVSIGFAIVSIAGVASYMNAIGASKQLVLSTSGIISKIKNPYTLLYMGMILVSLVHIFVTSASSLSLFLMGTLYPVLRSAGLSPKTVVSTIVIPTAWEFGPGQTDVVLAAQNSNMDMMDFIIKHQTIPTLILIILVPIINILWQTYLDKKDRYNLKEEKEKYLEEMISEEKEEGKTPSYYKYLPFLPFVFLFGFSSYFTTNYKMTVPIAMMMTMTISILIESIRFLSVKKAFANFSAWLEGTGKIFVSVITLLFTAQFFAEGLKHMGAIDAIISFAQTLSLSPMVIAISFSVFILLISFITGSGNAPFMAFVTLVPSIAAKFNISPILLVIPLIFAAGAGRSISPVSGVVIIVAGITKLSTLDVVKRTSVPTLFSMIVIWIWTAVRY